jgi:Zn-dependent protease with chaperone function
MTREIAPGQLSAIPVWVVPDFDGAGTCAQLGRGIIIPLSLLDQLSRKEIDAVVARQLCLQRGSSSGNLLWTLLASDVAVVVFLGVVHAGVAISCLAYISLVVAELLVLAHRLPRIFVQADLRAVRLTGDGESFLSALGGLKRFGGRPLAPEVLQQIANESRPIAEGVALLAGDSPALAWDRYPTSGSYMETGF